jgi:hypothetical protein
MSILKAELREAKKASNTKNPSFNQLFIKAFDKDHDL